MTMIMLKLMFRQISKKYQINYKETIISWMKVNKTIRIIANMKKNNNNNKRAKKRTKMKISIRKRLINK